MRFLHNAAAAYLLFPLTVTEINYSQKEYDHV